MVPMDTQTNTPCHAIIDQHQHTGHSEPCERMGKGEDEEDQSAFPYTRGLEW